jgi:hypothetical protein
MAKETRHTRLKVSPSQLKRLEREAKAIYRRVESSQVAATNAAQVARVSTDKVTTDITLQ